MTDEFQRLMSSNSIHNIKQETDTCDIEPWIEDWNEPPPKERSNTTPSEYYQCLSNTKIGIEKPRIGTGTTTSGAFLFRRMSTIGIDDSHQQQINVDPTPWEDEQQLIDDAAKACWHLPTKTDMVTPQANMLSTLRGRLRSIVLSKTKLELGTPETPAAGMRRACRSYTDVNEDEAAEARRNGGGGRAEAEALLSRAMPKVIRGCEMPKKVIRSCDKLTAKMANGGDGTTESGGSRRRVSPSASNEKSAAAEANRRQSAAMQSTLNAPISFHDLSASLIDGGGGGSGGAAPPKGFRSRAKSEAMSSKRRRENIYREKQQQTEKEEEQKREDK